MRCAEMCVRLSAARVQFRHLDENDVQQALDGFGGNVAGCVRWLHIIGRNCTVG
jgi:hypothetical protein